MIVNVYEVSREFVVDQPGDDPKQCMIEAMRRVKEGLLEALKPESRHVAIIPANQEPKQVSAARQTPNPGYVIQELIELPEQSRITAARVAGVIPAQQETTPVDWPAWLARVLKQSSRDGRLPHLLDAIQAERKRIGL